MKEYIVKVEEKYTRYVYIKAESKDKAFKIVDDKMSHGEIDLPCDGGDYKYDNNIEVIGEVYSEI